MIDQDGFGNSWLPLKYCLENTSDTIRSSVGPPRYPRSLKDDQRSYRRYFRPTCGFRFIEFADCVLGFPFSTYQINAPE